MHRAPGPAHFVSFQLQPHQQQNVHSLIETLRSNGGSLDGSDVGTGKTYTFLGLCKLLGARPAVVTRKAIIPSWTDACKLAGVDPLFITNYEQLLTEGFPYTVKKKVVSVSPDGTKKSASTKFEDWVLPEKRVLFAFDEAQALRSPDSFASNAALGARAKFKTVLLSGTPFTTPLEASTIGQIISLFSKNGYYRWLFQHGCKKDHFGRMQFIGDKPDLKREVPGTNAAKGVEIMLGLNAEIFPARGVRTRRSDIPGFPETLLQVEAVETGAADEIAQAYLDELAERRKQDHARAAADVDPEFHDLVEVLPVVQNLRHRQKIEALKARAMADLALMAHEKGEAVILYANFDATIEILSKYLDCDVIIRGDKSGRSGNNFDRARNIRNFQENRVPFIIINSAAGGAGISLHDPVHQKPRTSIISPPVSAVQLKQIFGRPQRMYGGFSTQKLVFASGTVEERVLSRVKNRMANLDALTDGDLDAVVIQ